MKYKMFNLKHILKNSILFFAYGFIYCLIEIVWRQYTHWSMLICGGLCGLLIGLLNSNYSWQMPLWKQVGIGEIIVLTLEFITGCVVNLWLGWNIWDYSSLPFNILGQICLPFAILWIPLILVVIVLDDYLRYWWFGEEKPHYKLF